MWKTTLAILFTFLAGFAYAQGTLNDDGSSIKPSTPGVATGSSFDATGAVSTLFAQDNGYAGNMFDVEVTEAVTITGLDCNFTNDPGETGTVQLYYRVGTSVGNEQNAAAWTFVGEDTNVVTQGVNVPTPVNITGLTLAPGQVYGFYVFSSTYATPRVGYTDGAATTYSDGLMTITTHCGNNDVLFGSFFNDRMWNGTIYYEYFLSTVPTMSEWGLIVFVILMFISCIVFLRRRI